MSVQRGAARSAIPPVLCALAAALFLQLAGSTVAYQASYDKLLNDTELFGYLTDYRGMRKNGLLLSGIVINDLYNSGILSGISVTHSRPYRYGVDPPEVSGGYAWETYIDEIASGPKHVWTNDLASVQEFYGCPELPLTLMDGYDLSVFSAFPAGETLIDEFVEFDDDNDYNEFPGFNWAVHEPTPAVVSTAFLESNGLVHGDVIVIATTDGEYRFYEELLIIGSFDRQGSEDNIYSPLCGYSVTYTSTQTVSGNEGYYIGSMEYLYLPSSYIFDPDPTLEQLRKLSFESADLSMTGASGLDEFKDFLYDRGYSEVNTIRDIRSFVVIEDKTFLATERAMAQRLWYMERIFPALYALLELLALLIPFILIQARKRESALMRVQGAAKRTAFFSVFWEQAMLCIPGVAIGMGVWVALFGAPAAAGRDLALLFALLWLLGAAVSAASLNRGSVRSILRAEE